MMNNPNSIFPTLFKTNAVKNSGNIENKKSKPKKKPFLIMRDYQTQQVCLLIGILNLKFEIVYEKPFKSTSKSLQFIKVSKLIW